MKTASMAAVAIVSSVALTAGLRAKAETRQLWPAMAGHGWPVTGANKATDCFESGWAEVVNNCATAKTFLVPLYSDAKVGVPLTKSFGFRAFGKIGPGTQVRCRAIENDGNNTAWFTDQGFTIGPNAAYQVVSLGSLVVEVGSTLHVDCSIDPGAKLVNLGATH